MIAVLAVVVGLIVLVFVLAADSSSRQVSRFLTAAAADTIRGATLYRGTTTALTAGQTGRKLALLFGLNYVGTANALRGCIQDVVNVRAHLLTKGFTSIELCTDDTADKPTRAVMLSKLTAFLGSLRPSDTAVLWYSGHGTLVSGRNAWVPLDFARSGMILESSVRDMVTRVPAGVRLTVCSDSCYSGSFMDLKYDVEPAGGSRVLSMRDAQRDAARATETTTVAETRALERLVPMGMPDGFSASEARAAVRTQLYALYDVRRSLSACRAHVMFLSGARDNQVAYDASINGMTQGAMTWSFLRAVRTPGPLTLGLVQDLMRLALRQARFPQVPQLSFGSTISPLSRLDAFGL